MSVKREFIRLLRIETNMATHTAGYEGVFRPIRLTFGYFVHGNI
jgi:hypothetical protein